MKVKLRDVIRDVGEGKVIFISDLSTAKWRIYNCPEYKFKLGSEMYYPSLSG